MSRGDFSLNAKAKKAENELEYIIKKYLPYAGLIGAGAFSVTLMAPSVLSGVFGPKNVIAQNTCFAIAHLGTGVYIYDKIPRKSLVSTPMVTLFTITGAVVFNYGSLLLLANVKHYLPQQPAARAAVGLGIVAFLFWTGSEYLCHNESSSRPLSTI